MTLELLLKSQNRFGLSVICWNILFPPLTDCFEINFLSVWTDDNVLKLDNGCTTLWYTENHIAVHFKIKWEFYGMLMISQLNKTKLILTFVITCLIRSYSEQLSLERPPHLWRGRRQLQSVDGPGGVSLLCVSALLSLVCRLTSCRMFGKLLNQSPGFLT